MDIPAGTRVHISHDIEVEGQVAFQRGESVVIESVSSNPDKPEYKYVVLSEKLGNRFQLSDADVMLAKAATPQGRARNGWMWATFILGTFFLIGGIIFVFATVNVHNSGNLQKRQVEEANTEISDWKYKYKELLQVKEALYWLLPQVSDSQAIEALARARFAQASQYQAQVIGDWGRVAVTPPGSNGKNAGMYFHKENDVWIYVTGNAAYGEKVSVPMLKGCPEQLITPFQN